MLGLVLRVLLSLAVVLGLFWLVARTGSRKLGGRDRAVIRVRGRQALSRGSSLAVVEVGSRVLVVGVSDGGVRLLTEMDPLELTPEQGTPVTSPSVEPVDDDEAASDQDFQAAYERASADAQGALAGSLLSGSTWRQAWGTATGRGHQSQQPGDAA